jgi:hypothetical protein
VPIVAPVRPGEAILSARRQDDVLVGASITAAVAAPAVVAGRVGEADAPREAPSAAAARHGP